MRMQPENPRFIAMLRAGVPVKDAYEVSHLGDIQARSAAKAAAEMEKRVMDNVRAGVARGEGVKAYE